MKNTIKKTKHLNLGIFIFTFLLLYFFIISVNYSFCFEKNSDEYLIPIGKIVQIDGELENLIVRTEANGCPLKCGDFIIEVEDKSVDSFSQLSDIFFSTAKDNLKIKIKRNDQFKTFICNKNSLKKINFNNAISGFATLTYINPRDNSFAAVGHPINIGSAKQINIKSGTISTTSNLDIEKSHRGSVGCINATRNYTIGSFSKNTPYGIKGSVRNIHFHEKKYKIADLNEIEVGNAQIILQNKDNLCKKYDIEILKIERQTTPAPKTFKIRITDRNLLNETGGIIQGMSGTPIIQGDKIIGAISHALENNPQIGYGVYIKWMI